MATALTLEQYLTDHGAAYDIMPHDPTTTSIRTASECDIPADCLAKAVVLRDGGGYLVAVLPASHHLQMDALESRLDRHLSLATEEELETLFPDCARGAVPPIGAAYGLETIVDDSITEMPDIYFEGGDHATLVHMRGSAFERLLADAPHGHFSRHD